MHANTLFRGFVYVRNSSLDPWNPVAMCENDIPGDLDGVKRVVLTELGKHGQTLVAAQRELVASVYVLDGAAWKLVGARSIKGTDVVSDTLT